MKITRHNRAVMSLEVDSRSSENLPVYLLSDVHFDSKICNINLLTKHLKEAESLNAPVIINGDLLDAMQGRYDPRREPEALKEKYAVNAYFDAIVADTASFLSGFDIPTYILGMGNHESSVIRNNGVDLLSNVAYRLRTEHKKSAISAGYWGYIIFEFRYKGGKGTGTKTLYWHHGKSTSAPVTRGVIQTNRQGVYLQSPDIVVNGHNHEAYALPVKVERLNARTKKLTTSTTWYVRTAGYKLSVPDAKAMYGYGAERHRAPKPNGCAVANLQYNHSNNDNVEIDIRQKVV